MSTPTPRDAHLRQAWHNEAVAESLSDGDQAHDWAVTASFYSALHFFDHMLLGKKVSVIEYANRRRFSPHTARSELAESHLDYKNEIRYRTLRIQSELARYMSSKNATPLTMAAFEYFDQAAAKNLVGELKAFRVGLGYLARS